jgi:hypothetical protein
MDVLAKPLERDSLLRRVELAYDRGLCRLGPIRGLGAHRLRLLVERAEKNRSTGAIELRRGDQLGGIHFVSGAVVGAQFRDHVGELALNELARLSDWQADFVVRPLNTAGMEPAEITDDPTADNNPAQLNRLRKQFAQGLSPPDESHAESSAVLGDEADTDPSIADPFADADSDTDQAPRLGQQAGAWAAAPGPTSESQVTGPDDDELTAMKSSLARAPNGAGREDLARDRDAPAAPSSTEGALEKVTIDEVKRWLADNGKSSLLVASLATAMVAELERLAPQRGFNLVSVTTGASALDYLVQGHPVAVICDSALADCRGSELVMAVRGDYQTREIPIILVSPAEISPGGAGDVEAAATLILDGLNLALSPRVRFDQRLCDVPQFLDGWVEPIGISWLLRAVGRAGWTGRLELRWGDKRNAEVVLVQGQVCGAAVHAPERSVGEMALAEIIGYEWQEFVLSSCAARGGQQASLGELERLVASAGELNNKLVQLAYDEGLKREGLVIDASALDSYFPSVPVALLDQLVRVVEGEPASEMVSHGEANGIVLKSLLQEMRRKSVLRATTPQVILGVGDSTSARQALVPARAGIGTWFSARRWPVIAAAAAATTALVLAAYLVVRLV